MTQVLAKKLLVAGWVLGLAVAGSSMADSPAGAGPTELPNSIHHARPMRDPPINATPLELELGYATYADFLPSLGTATKWADAGVNIYTRGLMFESDGEGLGIAGLTRAKVVFDLKSTLQAVILTFPRGMDRHGATADMAKSLGKKYKLVSKDFNSFMDFGSFHFEKGDSVILVDSPHLGFEMTVVYLTRAVYEADRKKTTDDAHRSQEHKDKML